MLEDLKNIHLTTVIFFLTHLAVQIALAFRVLMQRRPVGETLAWMVVIMVFWIVGPAVYLLLGELKLGQRRARRFEKLYSPIREWLRQLHERFADDPLQLTTKSEQISQLGEQTFGLPTLPGNQIELIDTWQAVFRRLEADINAAKSTCHLEFYIWKVGGEVDRIVEALIRARSRGVVCRVLVDAMGSRRFLKSDSVEKLRESGVQIQDALTGGILRLPFVRFDIRLHRKIIVIDGRVAYTGSLNMVDPRYFKKDSGVGQFE